MTMFTFRFPPPSSFYYSHDPRSIFIFYFFFHTKIDPTGTMGVVVDDLPICDPYGESYDQTVDLPAGGQYLSDVQNPGGASKSSKTQAQVILL